MSRVIFRKIDRENIIGKPTIQNDPAAVFGAASSLYRAADRYSDELSDAYGGYDQFMREVMRVATEFDTWAGEHVDFNELTDVWHYLLSYSFGPAAIAQVGVTGLVQFTGPNQCRALALALKLPLLD